MNNVVVFAPASAGSDDDGVPQLDLGYIFSDPSGLQSGTFSVHVPTGTLRAGTASQVAAALVAKCGETVQRLFPTATGMIIVGGLMPVEFNV